MGYQELVSDKKEEKNYAFEEIGKNLLEIGIPEWLVHEYITKNNIKSPEELMQKMAAQGLASIWKNDYSFKGLLRRMLPEKSELKSMFKAINKMSESEKLRFRSLLSGSLYCSLLIHENLSEAGITGKEADEIIKLTMFRHLSMLKENVYVGGTTQEIDIPFVLQVGNAVLGIQFALKDIKKEKDADNLLAAFRASLKSYLAPTATGSAVQTAKSIADNISARPNEIRALFLAALVEAKQIAHGYTYSSKELGDLVKTIDNLLNNAPQEVLKIVGQLENEGFNRKMKSKLDEKEEQEHLRRYLLIYLSEILLNSFRQISPDQIGRFINSALYKYIEDNAIAFMNFSTRSTKQTDLARFAAAPILPQLGYISDQNQEEGKKLVVELLSITMNSKINQNERITRLNNWQKNVLDAYRKALTKSETPINLTEDENTLAFFFLPEQLIQAKELYGEKWKDHLTNSIGAISELFNLKPIEVLHIFDPATRDKIRNNFESSFFFTELSKKGYSKDEIFWIALDVIPTVGDIALRYDKIDLAKQNVQSAIENIKKRDQLKKDIKIKEFKNKELEREVVVRSVTDGIIALLNEPYDDEVKKMTEKVCEYAGINYNLKLKNPEVEHIIAKMQNSEKISEEENTKLVNIALNDPFFTKSKFFKFLKAKGYDEKSILVAAYFSLDPMLKVYMKYSNAEDILEAAINLLPDSAKLLEEKSDLGNATLGTTLAGRLSENLEKVISGEIKRTETKISTAPSREMSAYSETTIERNSTNTAWVLEIPKLTSALFFAVENEIRRFDENTKSILKNGKVPAKVLVGEGDKKVSYEIELYDVMRHIGWDRGKAIIRKTARNYYQDHQMIDYNKVEALVKSQGSDSFYSRIFDVAKTKASRITDDEKQQKIHIAKFFVAELTKLYVEYGKDFFDSSNYDYMNKSVSLQFNKETLEKMVENLSLKSKSFSIVAISEGKVVETLGSVGPNGTILKKDSIELKPSDYIAIISDGTRLEAFVSVANYLAGRRHLFLNGDKNLELTMFNLHAGSNPFPLKFKEKKSSKEEEKQVPKDFTVSQPPVVPKPRSESKWITPLAVRSLRSDVGLPLVVPPLIAVVESKIKPTIQFQSWMKSSARFDDYDANAVLKTWGFEPSGASDVIQENMIRLISSLIEDRLGALVKGKEFTVYLVAWVKDILFKKPTASDGYVSITFTQSGPNKYDVTVSDSSGCWIIKGIFNRLSGDFIIKGVRSYAFVTMPILNAELGKGWIAGVDLKVGLPIELTKQGNFFLPSRFSGGNLTLVPIATISTPTYGLGNRWSISGSLGYAGGPYPGPVGSVNLSYTLGSGASRLYGGFGVSNLGIAPNVGILNQFKSLNVGGGVFLNSLKSGSPGFYIDIGFKKVLLRIIASPMEFIKKYGVSFDLIYLDNEGRSWGVISTPIKFLGKVPKLIIKSFGDKRRKGSG